VFSLPWGYFGELIGKRSVFSIDPTPPTHTTHTYTTVFGASIFLTLGVVSEWVGVCALAEGVHNVKGNVVHCAFGMSKFTS